MCLTVVACASVPGAAAAPSHAPAVLKAAPLVAVGPFLTSSSEEHRWLSFALAEMVASRLARSDGVHVLSVRQWGAVLRERDLALQPLESDADQRLVGTSLGARTVVTGSYQAQWPDVTVQIRTLEVSTGKVQPVATVTVHLEDAPQLEERLMKPLADALHIALPPAPPVRNVYAWRHASMCRELLTWQSLSPRAPPLLPRAAAADAEEHCRAALKLSPRDPDALEGLGISRALQGDVPGAVDTLKQSIAARSVVDTATVALFWVQYRTGKRQAALDTLNHALEKRPGFLHARGALGQALNEMGRHDEAAAAFEAYLAAAPNQPWALCQLGYTRARQSRPADGVELTRHALALAPRDPFMHMELASRYIDAKDLDNAEQTLRQAIEKDPTMALAYLRMGYVQLLKDQRDVARPLLLKALNEADLEAEWRIRGYAHFDLAKLEARAKDKEAAFTHIRQAIAAGFVDVERLEGDADFAALQQEPAFVEVLTQARTARGKWAMLASVTGEP